MFTLRKLSTLPITDAAVTNTVSENNRNNIMKIFLPASVTLMLMISTSCFAEVRSPATVEKELRMTAKVTVQTFRKGGISELFRMVEECYQKVEGNQFVCLYIDLASRHIDQTFAAALNYPPNDNFSVDQQLLRSLPVFNRAKMNNEQITNYLLMVKPVINKLVDQELSK